MINVVNDFKGRVLYSCSIVAASLLLVTLYKDALYSYGF